MRGTGGAVLEAGDSKVFRRVSGEAFPGIEEEGVLPDVHPRTPSTASEKAAEGSGMGEGDRTSQAGEEGQAELRLCNLVAQSPSDAEGGLQEGGREGADRAGDRTLGDYLFQNIPEPDAGH